MSSLWARIIHRLPHFHTLSLIDLQVENDVLVLNPFPILQKKKKRIKANEQQQKKTLKVRVFTYTFMESTL